MTFVCAFEHGIRDAAPDVDLGRGMGDHVEAALVNQRRGRRRRDIHLREGRASRHVLAAACRQVIEHGDRVTGRQEGVRYM